MTAPRVCARRNAPAYGMNKDGSFVCRISMAEPAGAREESRETEMRNTHARGLTYRTRGRDVRRERRTPVSRGRSSSVRSISTSRMETGGGGSGRRTGDGNGVDPAGPVMAWSGMSSGIGNAADPASLRAWRLAPRLDRYQSATATHPAPNNNTSADTLTDGAKDGECTTRWNELREAWFLMLSIFR